MHKIPDRFYPAIILLVVGFISLIASIFVQGSICPSMWILGVPCPACGISRAHVLLFNLDIVGAFKMFPLFWMPAAIAVLALANKLNDKIIWVFIALLIAVWIVRMILFFPGQVAPMELNESGLVPFILRLF